MRHEKIKQLAQQSGFDLHEDGNFYSSPQGQWINQEIYAFAEAVIQEFVPQEHTQTDLIYRLQERARIRRQIPTRLSVQENKPDRIADLLDEAATELLRYRPAKAQTLDDAHQARPWMKPLHEQYWYALYSADQKQSTGIRQ